MDTTANSNPNLMPPGPIPAILSYLIPGLGQIIQGRVGKGLLFFVSLTTLFFYGMWLGDFKNVYLPRYHQDERSVLARTAGDIYSRTQFVGQVPIGIMAWPAIYQYAVYEENPKELKLRGFQRQPSDEEINQQRDRDKTWDLGWVLTVIAGALNVLVIYDAYRGPALTPDQVEKTEPSPPPAA
jgi:hypothetical protein